MPKPPEPPTPDSFPLDDAGGPHGQARDYFPGGRGPLGGLFRILLTPATWVFFIALAVAFWVGTRVQPVWQVERITLDVQVDELGRLFIIQREKPVLLPEPVPLSESALRAEEIERFNRESATPTILTQVVTDGDPPVYYRLNAVRHWRYWSLLPALVAVALCWITREPLTSLFGGIVIGAFILQRYDLTDAGPC
jgi:hypothetical protein